MSKHESAGKSDEWYTPKFIFNALECRFDLDVAAPRDITQLHVPANAFIHENSLNEDWFGFVWCNPPFGGRLGIIPWLEKSYLHGNGITLTPDRTSVDWWQDIAMKADAHMQIRRKVKFISGSNIKNGSPSNGTTLFAFGSTGVEALLNAEKNGLGLVFIRQNLQNAS